MLGRPELPASVSFVLAAISVTFDGCCHGNHGSTAEPLNALRAWDPEAPVRRTKGI